MFDRPIGNTLPVIPISNCIYLARKPVIMPVMPKMKALRTEMIEDRDFKRHSNRHAYLSLYF